ncbi:ABC transporter permease [Porphyromonadaceae bacterium W3.11]|nr:ABC transporter permease [Porphyromonadaceae bacterium W3.11]
MKLEKILAVRFLYQEESNTTRRKKRLRPVVRISTIGIGLGVMLILLSLFIVHGFKQEIQSKINGFSGTVRISNPDNVFNQYYLPLSISDELLSQISVASSDIDPKALVNTFIDEMSLIRVDSAYKAVLMHGLDANYDAFFFQSYLKEGRLPNFSGEVTDEVMISKKIADHLNIKCGDTFVSSFLLDNRMKVRKFTVVGLFETGFDDYDGNISIVDQRVLRQVKDWSDDEVSGITITLSKTDASGEVYDKLYPVLADRNIANKSERYAMFTVEELNYSIFGWLNLLDANVLLILGLMIAVAGMTIITGVVVLILEKVRAIATLKALGQRNSSLRKVFILMASTILFKGIIWGNALALSIAFIQKYWQPITLDPSQYYMTHVPIVIDVKVLLLINILVFLLVFLFILIPTSIISNIKPSKSLRFE